MRPGNWWSCLRIRIGRTWTSCTCSFGRTELGAAYTDLYFCGIKVATVKGICRLCGLTKPLAYSHVVPEFVYRPVYKGAGADHWAIGVRRSRLGRFKPQKFQIGLRERLLCGDCEQFVNREYEQPSTRLWRHLATGAPLPHGVTAEQISSRAGSEGTIYRGVDYGSWKLFLLSILWRASVAGGEEWSGVDLGPMHETVVREILLRGDPKGQGDYPCAVYQIREPAEIIVVPAPVRLEGHRGYDFLLTNVALMFLVSSSLPPKMQAVGIDPSGKLQVAHLSLDQMPGMKGVRRVIKEAGKLPDSMT